ncbi:hypothetical protein NQ318_001597 [Aromia moschata]|uniref:RNase H type-1 domain-containing protein n=1 Tax=Aromia moschata TaxID=1265417 RepID=A0AAV8Y3C6_9CUCU|nr:hypothetical protein NQ318_001597 [Aromia moschata]
MTPRTNYAKPFNIQLNWDAKEETNCQERTLVWYTDGSKMDSGTGAGIYGERPRYRKYVPLGEYATVFQVEVDAIELCLRENIERGYRGKTILIHSDSPAALQALACKKIKSKLVWDCLETLQALANHNKEHLNGTGHKGVEGNKEADTLEKDTEKELCNDTQWS